MNYLSGDKWELEFRKRDLLPYEIKLSEKILKSTDQKYSYNEICMFSGGLDSFIGVIDLLEENTNNRLYVSHYGGGSGAIKFQNSLRTELIEKYKIKKNCFYKFYAAAINGVRKQY